MTIYYYIGGGVLLALCVWALGSYLVVRNLEKPNYVVLETRAKYEIRQYDSYIVAETTVVNENNQQGLSQGFSRVAEYIFGNNTSREKISMTTPVLEQNTSPNEKIAMTVPVLEQSSTNLSRTVSFVLPSAYTLDTLPIPNNNQVTLREVPSYTAAVLRFGWYGTPSRVANKKNELLSHLKKDRMIITGETQVAFYNPPLSMPLVLRNEIIIPIE
jgi:hypothetical protein